MPGELSLSPRSMVVLEGTGTEFDQTYYVDVIERRLNQDGGLTQRVSERTPHRVTQTTFGGDNAGIPGNPA